MSEKEVGLLDADQEDVDVFISQDPEGITLWVSVGGVCRLRATRCATFVMKDERSKPAITETKLPDNTLAEKPPLTLAERRRIQMEGRTNEQKET